MMPVFIYTNSLHDAKYIKVFFEKYTNSNNELITKVNKLCKTFFNRV